MSLAFEHFVAHHNWVFFKLSETDSAIGPQPNEDDQQHHIKFESFDLLSCIDVGRKCRVHMKVSTKNEERKRTT